MTPAGDGGWRATREQRLLLMIIGQVLDKQAGDGIGTTLDDGSTVWMDDLVGQIADTFGLDPDVPLDFALRNALPGPEAR